MTGAARGKERRKDPEGEKRAMGGGSAVYGGDDGGVAVVCFLVFLLHSRRCSLGVYLPTRSLVTKGQHTLAGHWLFPPSSFFPFTGEGPSLAPLASFLLSFSLLFRPFSFPSRSLLFSVSLSLSLVDGVLRCST